MQIQTFGNYNNHSYNRVNYNSDKKVKSQSFGSFCADANEKTQGLYAVYTLSNPDYFKMKSSSTRIFRELSSELAIAKLLNPKEKSEIKILGSADGSEAWAYAIAIKEAMGKNAKNVNIEGIDIAPYMTDLSNTGHLVLSSIEKEYADGSVIVSKDKSPLKGKGWDNYLIKTQRPEEFNKIKEHYPYTKYMEYDPVVNKSIGDGLEWYKVNKEGLPDVNFECADMRTSIKPNEDAENEVYVIANSAAYLISKDPNDFLKIFSDIKEQNKNKKNVYVVVGNLENHFFNSSVMGFVMKAYINDMGYENVTGSNLKKLGIKGNQEAASKIYKLKTR